MGTGNGKGRLSELIEVLSGPERIVILPHDNPDPDALASAAAVRYLLRALAEKDAVIAQAGVVGRAENRAMLKYANIELVPVGEVVIDESTKVVLVDTQPGRSNNSLPEGVAPTAVIDHHPAYAEYEGIPFVDLRPEYGATSTILSEYLRDSRLEIEGKIATALFYGIHSETQDLGREATPADVAASQFLYPLSNKRRLAKIENARVPREYFQCFRDAIEEAQIYENVVISSLGPVQYPDMVAEVADFLLRLDEADWAAAIGIYDQYLYMSLRTVVRDVHAGDVLRKALGSKSAGGHDQIAGGRVRLDDGGIAAEKIVVKVKERLLKSLDVGGASPTLLVG